MNRPGILTAGVDEAGRGPLAGPVVVAAVILNWKKPISGLNDSKMLSAAKREALFDIIQQNALAWSVIHVAVADIDRLNILQATLWGMACAVKALDPYPERVLIDGNRAPDLECGEVHTIVQGDRLEPCISAASIIAKVSRDRHMRKLHDHYPQYGFKQHKGYPTRQHLQLLAQYGPCAEHRSSFAPVRNLLQQSLFD